MSKLKYTLWLCFFIFVFNFHYGLSLLQCYVCTDCGQPFDETYPHTSIVTNQNYGSSCITTVLTVPTGKLVSRGTTFQCIPASTANIKVYCCQTNLCNESNSVRQFTLWKMAMFLLFPIFGSN